MASADTKHPNKNPFRGVLTILDSPSDLAPSGSRGHKVILTQTAAESALYSLIGMAVDAKTLGWDGHDVKNKCGIITSAHIEEKKLIVEGFIYGRDYPEVLAALNKKDHGLGMSYELADAHVTDMRASTWTLNRCMFVGAAILLRAKAAYRNTSFELVDRKAA